MRQQKYSREYLLILKEIIKNTIMGIPGLKSIRTKIGTGRTTGSLDAEEAANHAHQTIEAYLTCLRNAGFGRGYFRNKSILEIGTGASLLVPKMLLNLGANSVTTIDRFNDLRQENPHNYAESTAIKGHGIDEIGKGDGVLNIIYNGDCPIETAPDILPDKFEVIISHLSLEHTKNLDVAIKSISELLVPGGITLNICNLKSLGGVPQNRVSPIGLLTYSPLMWKLMFSNRGGSNRHRLNYYEKHFLKNGMEITNVTCLEKISLTEVKKMRPLIQDPFDKIDDEVLSITKFGLIGKKI